MAKKPFPFSVCEDCCDGGGDNGGSITIDTEMSDTSENAVQNKVIKKYVDSTKVFIINVSINYQDGTGTSDKNIADIIEAHKEGRHIIARVNDDTDYVFCSLLPFDDTSGEAYFFRIVQDTCHMLYCIDNGWERRTYNYAIAEDVDRISPLIVNVSVENDDIVADKDFEDLVEAYKSSRPIIVKTDENYYYLTYCNYDEEDGVGHFWFMNAQNDIVRRLDCVGMAEKVTDEGVKMPSHCNWTFRSEYKVATTEDIGDIETVLDSIIAEQETIIEIQNRLIGGESV